MGYNYDISEITVINQLQEELIQFFQALNKKDKSPYAPTSIKNCFAAIYNRYLQENSKISSVPDLYDECIFPRLHKLLDGKIKKIQDLSIIKQKKSDPLEYDEIYQILTHPELHHYPPLTKPISGYVSCVVFVVEMLKD